MFVLLPYPNYHLSAKIFSNTDLVEQISNVLYNLRYLHQAEEQKPPKGNEQVLAWRAWQGHEAQLAEYGLVLCEEAETRSLNPTAKDELEFHQLAAESGGLLKPEWFGNVNLHTSHQSRLLRSDPAYYGLFFPHIKDDIPTQWTAE